MSRSCESLCNPPGNTFVQNLFWIEYCIVNKFIDRFIIILFQGFRDNSTFASRENSTWQSTEDYMNNTSTLPLNTSQALTDSTLDAMKTDSDFQAEREYSVYYERPKSSALLETNLDEPPLPPPPVRSKSEMLLETDLDYSSGAINKRDLSTFQPALSKSQPLETAMWLLLMFYLCIQNYCYSYKDLYSVIYFKT